MRLYTQDAQALDALCAKLEQSEGEIIRRALQLLARQQRIASRNAKS